MKTKNTLTTQFKIALNIAAKINAIKPIYQPERLCRFATNFGI